MNEEEIKDLLKSHSEWCALAIERGQKLRPETWFEAARTIRDIMEQFPRDEWDLILDELSKEL